MALTSMCACAVCAALPARRKVRVSAEAGRLSRPPLPRWTQSARGCAPSCARSSRRPRCLVMPTRALRWLRGRAWRNPLEFHPFPQG